MIMPGVADCKLWRGLQMILLFYFFFLFFKEALAQHRAIPAEEGEGLRGRLY